MPHRRVPKQLDGRWVANRQLRPQLEALWRPADWQLEVSSTQAVALQQRITPERVAAALLALQ